VSAFAAPPIHVFLKLIRYARGAAAPWHILWQNVANEIPDRTTGDLVDAADNDDCPRPRSVEKAVVYAAFSSTLDRE
jgi:hypothetical protein